MVDLGPLPDSFAASVADVSRRGRGLRGLLAAMGDGATADRDRFAPGERGRIWFDRYARARGLTPIDPTLARGEVPFPPALLGLGVRLDAVAADRVPEPALAWLRRPAAGTDSPVTARVGAVKSIDTTGDGWAPSSSPGAGRGGAGPTIAYVSRLPLPYRLDPDRIGDTLVHVGDRVDPAWDLVVGHHDATRLLCAWPWRTGRRSVAVDDGVELLVPLDLTDDTAHRQIAETLRPWLHTSRGAVHVRGGDVWALAGTVLTTREDFDRFWPLAFLATDALRRRRVPTPWFPAVGPTTTGDVAGGGDPLGAATPLDGVLRGVDRRLLDWASEAGFEVHRHGAVPLELTEPDEGAWRSLTPMLHGQRDGRAVAVAHEHLHTSGPDTGAPRPRDGLPMAWTSVFVHLPDAWPTPHARTSPDVGLEPSATAGAVPVVDDVAAAIDAIARQIPARALVSGEIVRLRVDGHVYEADALDRLVRAAIAIADLVRSG